MLTNAEWQIATVRSIEDRLAVRSFQGTQAKVGQNDDCRYRIVVADNSAPAGSSAGPVDRTCHRGQVA